MSDALLSPRFLFRFRVPLRYCKEACGLAKFSLGDAYRLWNPAQLDEERTFADMRMGWNEQGIALAARVTGKRQPPWCRDTKPEDSDGLQVWLDTRDTHNIHRASRYCHRFVFLPAGVGRQNEQAFADQMIINRARENAKPIRPGALSVHAEVRADGYMLQGFIPSGAITGYEPAEHPRLGFTYAIQDRELGLQTFSVGSGFPYDEDPSVWATLELLR
ncbi:MAG: hypothetical protein WDZ59_00265 [Pirellulales bacterium]